MHTVINTVSPLHTYIHIHLHSLTYIHTVSLTTPSSSCLSRWGPWRRRPWGSLPHLRSLSRSHGGESIVVVVVVFVCYDWNSDSKKEKLKLYIIIYKQWYISNSHLGDLLLGSHFPGQLLLPLQGHVVEFLDVLLCVSRDMLRVEGSTVVHVTCIVDSSGSISTQISRMLL